MTDFNKEALAIWESLKPAVDKEIERKTAGTVQRRKVVVSTAPSSLTGLVGVQEPFGVEFFVPYRTEVATATVGDPVWIEFAYGANNAVAIGMASLVDTGTQTFDDVTITGTLDITPRRCSATLSSAGWYRVLKTVDAPGEVFRFEICRVGTSSNNETHTIDYHMDYGGKNYFLNETSVSGNLYIDKIRCTYDNNGNAYIDIHYNTSTSSSVYVHFSAEGVRDVNANTVSINLEAVADSPSGENTIQSYTFIAEAKPQIFKWEEKNSPSFSVSANDTGSIEWSVNETGWTPIGILQITGSGTTGISYSDWYITGQNACKVYFRNNTSSNKSSVVLKPIILYKKD